MKPYSLLVAVAWLGINVSIAPAEDGDRAEWAQWGGSPARNNVSKATNLPTRWQINSAVAKRPLEGQPATSIGPGICWAADVHPRAWPNGLTATPAVAGGKVFVGSKAFWTAQRGPLPKSFGSDYQACLLCFRESDGKFLWQYYSERLINKTVRQDYSCNPICTTPLVRKDRLWAITNRCEVICLDTEGFADDENDGPEQNEVREAGAADVVWKVDMIARFGVSPHENSNCSITGDGDLIFVCTSNGVDNGEIRVPAAQAPSFVALDAATGRTVWTDNSPGANILDGQWSSPAYGIVGGRKQVIFAGGDGWLYSFDPRGDGQGKSRLHWRFDCNPKQSQWGRPTTPSTRSNLIGMPVIAGERVYIALGNEGELDNTTGGLWCIDPSGSGDVSPELVFNKSQPTAAIAHKRTLACDAAQGDFVRPNPASRAVWHYTGGDANGDGRIDRPETLHGTVGSPVVHEGLVLLVASFDGELHCIDAATGSAQWIQDLGDCSYGTPLVADGKIFVGNENGEALIFKFGPQAELLAKNEMPFSIESTIVAVGHRLYVTTVHGLFVIEKPDPAR